MTKRKITKTDAEWRAQLTPEQYRIARQAGTERPFTGEHTDRDDTGTYHCVGCGAKLFDSDTKYHSGCGWPSFYAPADQDQIEERRDVSHGMIRTEVLCQDCGAHLGHVFPDGPRPTGIRYCINSAILDFKPTDE